jgi:hypothetical protein
MPERANNTHRKLTRRSAQTIPESQTETTLDAGLMWQAMQGVRWINRVSSRKKAVGEPDEGKPHVRFEVAGDGNQDKVNASEALSQETESNWSALPKSQAPSLDPTT